MPHFNEVDECAGLDGLMTYRVHKAMGQKMDLLLQMQSTAPAAVEYQETIELRTAVDDLQPLIRVMNNLYGICTSSGKFDRRTGKGERILNPDQAAKQGTCSSANMGKQS